jgi:hypothetical protein
MKRLALVLSAIGLVLVAIVATRAILSDAGGAESAGPVPSALRAGPSPGENLSREQVRELKREANIEAKLSREQARELKRAANDWASRFAVRACNRYMGQPWCARLDCVVEMVTPMENCTPMSKAFQKSFADATVENIKTERIVLVGWTDHPYYEAAVKFSNGEVVVFGGVRGPEPPAGSCAGLRGSDCVWNVAELDHNRRFLEAATEAPEPVPGAPILAPQE